MTDRYDALFEQAGRQYNVDPRLLKAMMFQESGGDPNALGPPTQYGGEPGARAGGLMQLMPKTARNLGLRDGEANDPTKAIPAAARLMAENLDRYGDPQRALAAWHGGTDTSNWGPRTNDFVQRVAGYYQDGRSVLGSPAPVAPAANPRATSRAPAVAPVAPAAQVDLDSLRSYMGGGAPAPARPEPATVAPEDLRSYMTGETQAPGPNGTVPAPGPSPQAAATGPMGRFMAGIDRGTVDAFDGSANLLARGAEAIGIAPAINKLGAALGVPTPTSTEMAAQQAPGRAEYERDYGNSGLATAGRIVGQVGTMVPGLGAAGSLIRGGITRVGAAAPVVANGLTRLGQSVGLVNGAGRATAGGTVALGATAGALDGAATGAAVADPSKPLWDQTVEGAAGGAVGGGVVGPALRAAGRGVSNFFSPAVNTERAALADAARQMGVHVRGTQITESPAARAAAGFSDNVIGGGNQARNLLQQRQFTGAVVRQMGETGNRLTPEVVQAAQRTAGDTMERVARTTDMRIDLPFRQDLMRVANDAGTLLQDAEFSGVMRQLQGTIANAQNGTITGANYQALTRRGTPLDRAMNSSNPNIAHYAGQIRNSLDSLLERHAPAADLDALREARRHYYVAASLRKTADEAGADSSGLVSPNRFASAFPDSHLPEINALRQIGRTFIEPTLEGAANHERNRAAGGKLAGAGLVGMGLFTQNPNYVAAGAGLAALGSAASAGVGAAANSQAYRNSLIREGRRVAAGGDPQRRLNMFNDAVNSSRPGAIGASAGAQNYDFPLFIEPEPKP